MRLRLILFALVAATVVVPAATAEGPPQPPKERPAPGTFPPDAAQRLAAEVCARVQVENCLEKATELATAALEGCRDSATPAMCVKEAVVRGLTGGETGDEPDEETGEQPDGERLATSMCTTAQSKFPERFAQRFASVEACVAALQEALAKCPAAVPTRGCLVAALTRALNAAGTRGEKGEQRQQLTPRERLARSLERALCRPAELRGRRCSPAVRAKARAIAARCANAADPKACVREALKPTTGRKP